MAENVLLVGILALLCAGSMYLGGKHLPRARWQFFAAVPLRSRGDGSWEAVTVTWYGILLAGAAVFAIALYLAMLAAVGVALVAALVLMILLMVLCVPAASWVARLVERKPATLTIGGAAFVGNLVAPLLVLLLNQVWPGGGEEKLPMAPVLAACAGAFLFGEGFGRMACLSYGCCYGKPVSAYGGLLGRFFALTPLVFQGSTKKISYAGGLEGRPVVPIQVVTMVVLTGAGFAALLLFGAGHFTAAYLLATASAGIWRVISELFRSDHRGGGRLSAYQYMALASVVYGVVVAGGLADGTAPVAVSLLRGVLALWSPGVFLVLAGVWLTLILYTGISRTTYAHVRFFLHQDRI